MSPESKNLILEILRAERDKYIALFDYLNHQLNQRPEHRVCEETEVELADAIRLTYANKFKLTKLVEELINEK